MVGQFRDEELNYFEFASIVLNEFPKASRKTFKLMWDNTFGPGNLWDDSVAVRKSFLAKEAGRTKAPTNESYMEWDCTVLFQATIYAQCFALPASKGHYKTLSDMYVRPLGLHAPVVSPSGNHTETFTLAIDQLRILRDLFCHSTSCKMNKITFNKCVQHAKATIKALKRHLIFLKSILFWKTST